MRLISSLSWTSNSSVSGPKSGGRHEVLALLVKLGADFLEWQAFSRIETSLDIGWRENEARQGQPFEG
jgi:hypothetical protein